VESSCEGGNELSVLKNAGILSSGYTTGGLLTSAQLQRFSEIRII
jgi:hypothetical protein